VAGVNADVAMLRASIVTSRRAQMLFLVDGAQVLPFRSGN
jgi:hypothetical protein